MKLSLTTMMVLWRGGERGGRTTMRTTLTRTTTIEIKLDNNDGVVEGGGEGRQDNNEDYIDKDNNNYDVRWGSGPEKRHKVAMLMTLVYDHALDNDDLH
jgi:hypothetical protein